MFSFLKKRTRALLRASERYTGTDMIYLARGGTWLTAAQVISAVAAFLIAVSFANLLPKEAFGVYRYVLSFASILMISTLIGINTSVVRSVAQGKEGSYTAAFRAKIRWGIMGSIASALLALYYIIQDNHLLGFSFLLVAVFLPFKESLALHEFFLHGRKRFDAAAKRSILTTIGATATLLGVLWLTDNVLILLASFFGSWTALRLLFFVETLKKFPPNTNSDSETVPYGRELSGLSVIEATVLYIDKLIVFHFLGAIAVAVYAIATAPVDQIRKIVNNVGLLALPRFTQHDASNVQRKLFAKSKRLLLLLVVIVVGYILVAPTLFAALFPTYGESILFSQIYALSLFLIPALPRAFLEAHKAIQEQVTLNVISGGASVALMLGLLPLWGLWGVLLGRLLGQLINFLLFQWFAHHL